MRREIDFVSLILRSESHSRACRLFHLQLFLILLRVAFTPEPSEEKLRALVNSQPVVLFMKGTKSNPFCKFSRAAIGILDSAGQQNMIVNRLLAPSGTAPLVEIPEVVAAHWETVFKGLWRHLFEGCSAELCHFKFD